MQKTKNQISKFIKNEYLPFVALAFLLLFFHACIHVGPGDDEYFKSVLNDNNMFEWLTSRYIGWSSRLVIEFFLVTIAGQPILWRLLNTAVVVLGAISISKIFSYKKSTALNWIICALILCLPVSLYNSAGWIATTLNYSWVVFLGLFAMIPIKKILCKENIKWYEYVFYFIAMIYAANQEQMCLILLAVYFIFTCYIFYQNRKLNWFVAVSTGVNLVSLVFILTCPGNVNRKICEIGNWFPDFNNLSLFRKLEMGYSGTLFEFIMRANFIFFVFSLLLFVCVVLNRKM